MIACYVTAAGVSLVLGIVGFRVERYHYWQRYIRRGWVVILCVVGQAATYLGAGLLAAVTAHTAGAKQAYGESWLTGVAYGCVPHGLARVPVPDFVVQNLHSPKSPLGALLSWITQWLDYVAKRAVQTEVRLLRRNSPALIMRSWDIYWDTFFLDSKIKDHQKQVQHDLIESAVGKIENDADRANGVGCLTNFCIGEITRRYLVP